MKNDAVRNKIIYLLLVNDNLNMEEITAEIGTQEEVYAYINEINDSFKSTLSINVTDDNHQICVNILNKEELYSNLKKNIDMHDYNDVYCRIAYLLNELIQNDTYFKIVDFCDHMNVSRSTVNNDLRRVKSLLKKYNAEIIGVPNKGIKIKCSEFNKRLILIHEVFDYFPNTCYIDDKVIKLIKSMAEYYGLNNSSKILLYKALIISIDRVKRGFLMKQSISMYNNFEIESEIFNKFICDIKKIYKIHLSNQEINFISFPINIRSSAYTKSTINTQNEEILFKIITRMIENVNKKFMIHINETQFFEKVKFHLLFLINRLVFKIPVKDIFSEQIKIWFPLAFELAKISMDFLYNEYELTYTSVDISYFAVYFALILDERKSICHENNSIKNVAVVTNTGRGTFELIKRQLEEVIGSNSKIDHLTSEDLTKKDLSKYGMLFTTENIKNDVHLPVINISGIIDSQMLTQKISEIQGKMQILNEDKYMYKFIDLKVIELNGKNSYKDNIKIITDHLIKEGNASKNVYDIFEQKSKLSPMIYENGVAFPHLKDEVVDKLSLTLGIVRPDIFGIKIIFFLLIPENINEEQENILMKIYDQIFSVISEQNLVSKIQCVRSVNDFRSFLVEGRFCYDD